MSRRLALTLAMLVVGTALLVASGLARSEDSAVAAGKAPKGGTFRMSSSGDVDSADPALAYSGRSWLLEQATCAKLFNYPDTPGAAGTRLVEEVVRSYTVSRDGRTYDFDLRRTFRFSTGAPVTAQSFADAFDRDAQLESPATSYMQEIVGADTMIAGRAKTISGVRVLDTYRLEIRLTKPLGDFTARLTMPFFCPILPNTPITELDTPVGSGPYYVAERIVNQRILLKRNPYYSGNRPANVDQVVWTFNSFETCLLAVEQDRIDYCYPGISRVPRDLAERYGINRPDGQFFVGPAPATWYLAFNHDRPAFRGPGQIALKKAINYAIDRPELARAFGYLGGKRTDQMLPPALARAESIYPLAGSDYATARKWLRRAKHQPSDLVLYADNSPLGVALSQIIVFNIDRIGIDVHVKYFDINALADKVATRGEPFDLHLLGWIIDYPDGAGFFVPLLSRGAGHGVNLDDARIQHRIDEANRLTGEARRKAWADLDVDLMRDNPPWAPFVHPETRTFVSKSTGCVFVHAVLSFDIAAVCKK